MASFTEKRLNKIEQVARDRDKAVERERAETERRRCDFVARIKTIAERIQALMDVAQGMACYGLQLGEFVGDWNTKSPRFISDGIFHRFGFIVDGCVYKSSVSNHNPRSIKVLGVGKKGGGCCGSDFIVNSEGVITSFNIEVYENGIDDFLAKFDKFEKEFYEYVDNL